MDSDITVHFPPEKWVTPICVRFLQKRLSVSNLDLIISGPS
jgi:hypothetical protein